MTETTRVNPKRVVAPVGSLYFVLETSKSRKRRVYGMEPLLHYLIHFHTDRLEAYKQASEINAHERKYDGNGRARVEPIDKLERLVREINYGRERVKRSNKGRRAHYDARSRR